jgi:hypothetical protein
MLPAAQPVTAGLVECVLVVAAAALREMFAGAKWLLDFWQ